jgi:hypothetical protein
MSNQKVVIEMWKYVNRIFLLHLLMAAVWLTDWLAGSLNGWQSGWLAGCDFWLHGLACWLAALLPCWLAGFLPLLPGWQSLWLCRLPGCLTRFVVLLGLLCLLGWLAAWAFWFAEWLSRLAA